MRRGILSGMVSCIKRMKWAGIYEKLHGVRKKQGRMKSGKKIVYVMIILMLAVACAEIGGA